MEEAKGVRFWWGRGFNIAMWAIGDNHLELESGNTFQTTSRHFFFVDSQL